VTSMGKKNKNKKKKINPKKEKYKKYHGEKAAILDVRMPDLTPDQQKQRQMDEQIVGTFLRRKMNPPVRELKDIKKKRK
jgi:hypothetical protein